MTHCKPKQKCIPLFKKYSHLKKIILSIFFYDRFHYYFIPFTFLRSLQICFTQLKAFAVFRVRITLKLNFKFMSYLWCTCFHSKFWGFRFTFHLILSTKIRIRLIYFQKQKLILLSQKDIEK